LANRCKAAVAWKPRRSLTVEEMEVPPPKTHEVLVQGRRPFRPYVWLQLSVKTQ
uniref:Uncharacterized protein n=1 Tax=Oryzias latipes TaxID=8090 RepID=A0A3B3I7Y2_ORYLA